jgi:polyisoprenoid-binding protein YceI
MEEGRMKTTAIAITLSLLVAGLGCKDPTAGKPKAEISSATPAPAAPPTNTPSSGAESLAIDPSVSKVDWVASKVTKSHNGKFSQFNGKIDLVGGKPEASKVTVEIDTNSVESDNPKLTGHLKSADFFDVAKYPKATFTSTEVKPGGSGGATHTVTGVLDLHGVKKSITFPAKVTVGDSDVAVQAEFSLNRKDFNINYAGAADDLIRDDVLLKLDVKAPRKK